MSESKNLYGRDDPMRRDAWDEGYEAGARDMVERCAKVAEEAHVKWKANADRPQSEHSGPSYAAAVAGEAASRDIAAAIRALSAEGGKP